MCFVNFISIEAKADQDARIIKSLENQKISFDEKYKLLDDIYQLGLPQQQKALAILLNLAKKEKKETVLSELYSRIAHNYLFLGNSKQARLELDSASTFLSKTTKNNTIALYYYVSGDYYNSTLDEAQAHKNYYQAIRHYEQSDGNYVKATYILHNIAFSYIQKKDASNLKILLKRMRSIFEKDLNNVRIEVPYKRVNSYYYSILYENEKNSMYLDSAIINSRDIITRYEQDKNKELIPQEVAYDYICFVENSLKKGNIDYDQAELMVDKAMTMAMPTDTAMRVNSLWSKAQIYKEQNESEKTKVVLEKQLQLMNNWSVAEDLAMYVDLYSLLSDVCNNLGEYKEALAYKKEELKYKDKIIDEKKYQIISDLQTKYETEKKEAKINQQRQLIVLLSAICIIAIIGVFFLLKWKRVLKIVNLKQKKIVKLQKSEAKLQMQNDSKKADIQEHQNLLINKVSLLVNEKLQNFADDQKRYLDKLDAIDRDSIFILQNKGFNELRIQYCICFGIGMKKEHISLCYNIVDQTIRKHRSTIKGELELEKDDDLNLYLMDLFTGNVY